MLYRLLTGNPPHQGEDVRAILLHALNGSYQPVIALNEQAPLELIEWQQAAMAMDPADRCTIQAFREGLDRWLHRVEAEERAQELYHHTEQEFHQQAVHLASDQAYAWYQKLVNTLDQVLSIIPTLTAASELRQEIYQRWVESALDAEDIDFAADIVQEIADENCQQLVQQAQAERRQRRRRRRMAASLVFLTLIAVLLTVWYAIADAQQAQERQQQLRRVQAAELIAQSHEQSAEIAAEIPAERSLERLWMLYQAAGWTPKQKACRIT